MTYWPGSPRTLGRAGTRPVSTILTSRPSIRTIPSQGVTSDASGLRPTAEAAHTRIHRLRRPLGEMLTIARHPFANSRDVKTAVHLVRLLPPANIFASIKNGQYISRLSHSWHEKSRAAHVVLFDQGFVQAVCSLALLAGVANDTPIANALDYAPISDLLIHLKAPSELLRTRLHDRRRLQSTIEHLFEPDLKTSLASISMIGISRPMSSSAPRATTHSSRSPARTRPGLGSRSSRPRDCLPERSSHPAL